MTPADAKNHIKTIAALQREIAEILEEVGARVRAKEEQIAKATDELTRSITQRRDPALAKAIAEALEPNRINVGELSSRFADALERRGHHIYPEPYQPIRAAWALVTSR
jgi:hypothetical protein